MAGFGNAEDSYMRLWQLFSRGALVLAMGIAGCSSSPALYQLQSGATLATDSRPMAGVAVLLGPIGLPDYLKKNVLVQRQIDGSLKEASSWHWAGSLQDNISRLVLHRLSEQLNSGRLVLFEERAQFQPEVQAIVRIDRLDSGPAQPAVLEAQWRLLDAQGEQRNSRILHVQEAHTGTPADQVRAQSALMQQLSDQLGRDIQWVALELQAEARNASSTKSGSSSKKRVVSTPSPEPKEADKKVQPVRTDMEVLRF